MFKLFLVPVFLLFLTSLWGQNFVPKRSTVTIKTINSTYTPEKSSKNDILEIQNFWKDNVEFLTIIFWDGNHNIPFDFEYQKTTLDNGIEKKFFILQYCDGTALVIYIPKQKKISFWNGQLLSDGSKQFFHYYW